MAEDVVSIHSGAGTLAQQVMAQAPEGMLIAPVWKRVAAFILDTLLITIVLGFISSLRAPQPIVAELLQFSYFTEGPRYTAFFFMNWVIFFVSFWLYFKYTGKAYSRSLGQRAFRIAIVHDNGTILEDHHWGSRAFGKLKYLIPVIGWLIFGLSDAYKAQSKDSEYRTSVDIKNHTVAAVDWSLPSETRFRLK